MMDEPQPSDESNPLLAYLQYDDTLLDAQWQKISHWVENRFGRTPSLETILFLIGVQARGKGFEPNLDRTFKQNLIMEGTYQALETLGVYHRVGMEEDGHWIWERLLPYPPGLSAQAQEKLLRLAIIQYFQETLTPTQDHEL